MRDKRRLRRRVPTSYAEFLADFFNTIRQERTFRSGANRITAKALLRWFRLQSSQRFRFRLSLHSRERRMRHLDETLRALHIRGTLNPCRP